MHFKPMIVDSYGAFGDATRSALSAIAHAVDANPFRCAAGPFLPHLMARIAIAVQLPVGNALEVHRLLASRRGGRSAHPSSRSFVAA